MSIGRERLRGRGTLWEAAVEYRQRERLRGRGTQWEAAVEYRQRE